MAEEAESTPITFESLGVPSEICKAVTGLGWKAPSPIQRETLPYSLAGKDIIGLAQTGSGKTGAFLIPIVAALLKSPSRLFAIVLSPTRELAFQIGEQCEALGASLGIICSVLVGGIDNNAQALALGKRPHIIIGTPGRVVYHLQNTKGFTLQHIKYLVLDEADRLLNLDFESEINSILSVAPRERNTFLFSATMTSKVAKLQRASLVDPVKIEVNTKNSTVETLNQSYIFIPEKDKDCYLVYLLNEFAGNSIIIFTLQCMTCQKITLVLRNLGFAAIPLNGKMTQTKRLGALNKFKAKDRSILVATDVASRGLDIPDVDLVLNYDIPTSPKDYVHRVGRTARAGKGGRAINLVTQYDVETYQKCEEFIDKKLDLYPTEESLALVAMDRVAEAQRLAAMELRESGFGDRKRKVSSRDVLGDDRGGGAPGPKKQKVSHHAFKSNKQANRKGPKRR